MSALNLYRLAAERARRAAEACVHWDYETRDDEPGEHECCQELYIARVERQKLIKRVAP